MSAMIQAFANGRGTLPVLVLAISLISGCITEPDSVDNDASNTIIEIVSMEGQAVGTGGPGEESTDLFSDVCAGTGCSVFNDNGIVSMRAYPKDRTQLSTLQLGVNSVTFERYRVTYVRADGRNVPGVDVPYPFDGAVNFSLAVNGDTVSRGFVVVRHQAKVETPLRELQGATNFAIISTLAQIDFYGHDGAGRTVTATAYLNITFADFAG